MAGTINGDRMPELETYQARPVGAIYDVSPENVPPQAYTFAQNARFQEDRARRGEGMTYRSPEPLFNPERLHYRNFQETNQWLYAGDGGIGLDVVTQFNVTPANYPNNLAAGLHGWTDLNGIPVWNHRGFTPHFHDGQTGNVMQQIPAWPTGWFCNRMVSFKFYLIAIGGGDANTDIEDQIRWSASADPGNLPGAWVPTTTNDAGDLAISDTPGPILDAVGLRDSLVIYKGTGAYVLQFIGGLFVFAQRRFLPKTGALTDNCVQSFRGRHYVVTQGDVVVHDGARVQSVVSGKARRAIFEDLSGQFKDRAFTYIDPMDNTFCFCWPSLSSRGWCDRRARFSIGGGPEDGAWSIEKLMPDELSDAKVGAYQVTGQGGDWDSEPGDWDTTVGRWDDQANPDVGSQVLEAYIVAKKMGQPQDGGDRAGVTPITELRWEGKELNPGRSTLVDTIRPIFDNPGNAVIKLSFGFQESLNEPISWTPEITANGDKVDVALQGRYFSLRLRAEDERDWAIEGFDIEHGPLGRYGG